MITCRQCRPVKLLSSVCAPLKPTPAPRRLLSTPRLRVADILKALPSTSDSANHEITATGFVRSVRKQKRVAFAAIGDGSSLEPLQTVLTPQQAEKLSTGVAVAVTGKWTPSPAGKEQANELHAGVVEVLGGNDATAYPIQKKYQTAEFLRTLPHLRPRIPFNALLLRLRSQVVADLTEFFSEQGFVQTHTPIITSSDCEGAGEVFVVNPTPTTDNGAPCETGKDSNIEQFFRSTKYLTVSSQLHLEALSQAVGNVWTLSPTFRAEKSDTARHLSEFYMLEAEMAFVDKADQVMDVVENMIRYIASKLQRSSVGEELLMAHNFEDSGSEGERHASSPQVRLETLTQRWNSLVKESWPRITYHEACATLVEDHCQRKVQFDEMPSAETGLATEHERYLAETLGKGGPVFVTDYPAAMKPFYMAPSASSAQNLGPVPTVACFDLLMPDVCEVVGGSMREHRLEQLLETMRSKGLGKPEEDGTQSLDWYIDLRRYGSLPHGGFGLGFDRLLSFLAGVSNVRDMVTFPRHYGRCLC